MYDRATRFLVEQVPCFGHVMAHSMIKLSVSSCGTESSTLAGNVHSNRAILRTCRQSLQLADLAPFKTLQLWIEWMDNMDTNCRDTP